MEYIDEAKAILTEIFKHHSCTYGTLKDCGSYNTHNSYGQFTRGSFRTCFIPKDFPFIIKTGYTRGGRAQCEREANNYGYAVEYGVEKFFAEYYGKFTFRKKTFYVFEKIKDVGCSWQCYETQLNENYDRSERDELENFLSDFNIGDLHSDNYGKRGDDYVIVDYSGITWEDWEG